MTGETAMKDFMGRGWAFPIETNRHGEIRLVEGEKDIEQAVRLILSTAPGERVMRPEFGCGIHRYAFSTVDTTTLTVIEDEVGDALARWEPRIEVLAVDAELADPTDGKLSIDIGYRERRTNSEHNLVYPFYLEGD